jgi:hypothetical protein
MMEHPTQTIVLAEDNVLRFQENPIVTYLLDKGGISMTNLACKGFSDVDRRQFAQLIGYSVTGYNTLSYVDK